MSKEIRWWVSVADGEQGPMFADELLNRLQHGEFQSDTPCRPEWSFSLKPIKNWPQLSEGAVPDIVDSDVASSQQPAMATESPEPADSGRVTDRIVGSESKPASAGSKSYYDDLFTYIVSLVFYLYLLRLYFSWLGVIAGILWLIFAVAVVLATFVTIAVVNEKHNRDPNRLILFAGICAVVAIGTWFLIPTAGSSPASERAVAESSVLNHPESEAEWHGRKTLEYWNAIRIVGSRLGDVNFKDDEETQAGLSRFISEIENLPAVGVDADAIACSAALRRFYSMLAAERSRNSSPERLFEAIARGARGDLFGTFLDANSRSDALLDYYMSIRIECGTVQATLSSRYGIEFPALFTGEL